MNELWKPTLITAAVLLVGGGLFLGVHWMNLDRGEDAFVGTYACTVDGKDSSLQIDAQKHIYLSDGDGKKEAGQLRLTSSTAATLDLSEAAKASPSALFNPIADYQFRSSGPTLLIAGSKSGSTLFAFHCQR